MVKVLRTGAKRFQYYTTPSTTEKHSGVTLICSPPQSALVAAELSAANIKDASERLRRFQPFIAQAFPETASSNGVIESQLVPIPAMQQALAKRYGTELPGEPFCSNAITRYPSPAPSRLGVVSTKFFNTQKASLLKITSLLSGTTMQHLPRIS